MAGTKRKAPQRSRPTRSGTTRAQGGDVADIYRSMLRDARREGLLNETHRPIKRRRPGERSPKEAVGEAGTGGNNQDPIQTSGSKSANTADGDALAEDGLSQSTVQVISRDFEDDNDDYDDDDDDEIQFEDIDLGDHAPGVPSITRPGLSAAEADVKQLKLNLTAQKAAMTTMPGKVPRKAPINKAERLRRIEVHKLHLLCLLAHVYRRNRWCNDAAVQKAVRPLLSDKTIKMLNPSERQQQLGRSDTLRKGIQEARTVFGMAFKITERGMRRALWAEDRHQLESYKPPADSDSVLDKTDFLQAAKTLRGSRDVGAQLFCSLLRAAGVRTRLVCSLQPLSLAPGGPTSKGPRGPESIYQNKHTNSHEAPSHPGLASPRQRLGHADAAAYMMPTMTKPFSPSDSEDDTDCCPSFSPQKASKVIGDESPYPIYWVEVLDTAYQKWQPVDPLVTRTQWKPHVLEPPSTDAQNALSYVMALEPDGFSARDVTRRYAKAYAAKTLKTRIDGAAVGCNQQKWWHRLTRCLSSPLGPDDDLDAIEGAELAATAEREPMPRNVADFRLHPVYALERHLRRNELLVPGAQASGTITVGGGTRNKQIEKVYRRQDVRTAWSREKWLRLGREVTDREEAVKVLPPKKRQTGIGHATSEESEVDHSDNKTRLFGRGPGTPLFTLEQTHPYRAPPVVDGRVPKNKFGNVDLFVPDMCPPGGVWLRHDKAALAAHILGVDHAPALVGFRFVGQSRKGSAILDGVVVAGEVSEGVCEAIRGLEALEREAERERRSAEALRVWRRMLRGLRIRERIGGRLDDGDESGDEQGNAQPELSGQLSADDDGELQGGGGFCADDDDDHNVDNEWHG